MPTWPELIAAANAITEEARAVFSGLTPQQLNWKPGPDRWSVGQCLDHLVTANGEYFPLFDAILNGTKKSAFWERVPGLPALWGRMMIRSVSPDSKPKLRAPKIFQPTASSVDGAILQRFLDQQEQVIRYMKASEPLKAAKIIITSPVTSLITYSLLDAFRILVAHEQRHLLQARKVMETAGFGTNPS